MTNHELIAILRTTARDLRSAKSTRVIITAMNGMIATTTDAEELKEATSFLEELNAHLNHVYSVYNQLRKLANKRYLTTEEKIQYEALRAEYTTFGDK